MNFKIFQNIYELPLEDLNPHWLLAAFIPRSFHFCLVGFNYENSFCSRSSLLSFRLLCIFVFSCAHVLVGALFYFAP